MLDDIAKEIEDMQVNEIGISNKEVILIGIYYQLKRIVDANKK